MSKKSIRFFNDREVRAVWDDGTAAGGSRLRMWCAIGNTFKELIWNLNI